MPVYYPVGTDCMKIDKHYPVTSHVAADNFRLTTSVEFSQALFN